MALSIVLAFGAGVVVGRRRERRAQELEARLDAAVALGGGLAEQGAERPRGVSRTHLLGRDGSPVSSEPGGPGA